MADEEITTVDETAENNTETTENTDAAPVDGFAELREQLAALSDVANTIAEGVEALRSSMAGFVEAGATIREEPETGTAVSEADADSDTDVAEVDLETPIEDMDFDLD